MEISEIRDLIIAWIILTIAFSADSILKGAFWLWIGIVGTTLGLGFIAHEISHKFLAQRYGCMASFRIWPIGLVAAIAIAFATSGRFVFAAPGAVYIIPYSFYRSDFLTEREYGLIALAGPLSNILLALLLFSLSPLGGIIGVIGTFGYKVNMWLALFNLIPIPPLDGNKVIMWNKGIWVLIFFSLCNLCLRLVFKER
jgi:Zn-dependent protease